MYRNLRHRETIYILRVNYKLLLDLQLTEDQCPKLTCYSRVNYINEFPSTVPTMHFTIKLYLDMMHCFFLGHTLWHVTNQGSNLYLPAVGGRSFNH